MEVQKLAKHGLLASSHLPPHCTARVLENRPSSSTQLHDDDAGAASNAEVVPYVRAMPP